jgi:hypothetical protein
MLGGQFLAGHLAGGDESADEAGEDEAAVVELCSLFQLCLFPPSFCSPSLSFSGLTERVTWQIEQIGERRQKSQAEVVEKMTEELQRTQGNLKEQNAATVVELRGGVAR